jgi:hypothetical protein
MVQIAFSSSSVIGTIIREMTGGDVNHVFFIFECPVFGGKLTLGCNANGLTISTLEKFKDRIVHVFEPVDPAQGLEIGLKELRDLLDEPYDYAGLIGMAVVEAERRLGIHQARNPLLSKHELFCSEFGLKAVVKSGYDDILPGIAPGDCDPNQLCEAIKKSPRFDEVPLFLVR